MRENNLSPEKTTASTAYSSAALEWLNAKPAPPARADLTSIDGDLSIRLIYELPAGKDMDLPIAANHPASEWLLHLYFESRNRERVFGSKNLGIGYPVLTGKLGNQDLSAPLFVWHIVLEPSQNNTDNWQVTRQTTHPITPNYPLFHLLDSISGGDFTAKARYFAENEWNNTQAFLNFCELVSSTFSLYADGLPLGIKPFPDEESLRSGQNMLSWTAVAGIYPTLPRTITGEAPAAIPDPQVTGDTWIHTFSMLPLDPSQRAALEAVQNNALTVVEGASGSGKTFLISAIVMNALSHGKKCLVVSKSINSLRRAQKMLLDKGIGELSFVLRDLEGDKLMLADMLRMSAESKSKANYNRDLFQTVLNKTIREQNKLDNAWKSLHKPLFGSLDFSETVGRYLRANRTEGKELLLSQLNPQDFSYNEQEYNQIVDAIYASEPLFRRFPTLHHPLGNLNGNIFSDYSSAKGMQWTSMQVKSLSDKATALHHRYISQTNDYAESLQDHFEQYYFELSAIVKRIKNSLEDGVTRFGPDFEKPISSAEKLYGIFSDKYKEIVAAKERIGGYFEELLKTYSLRRYFEFDFPQNPDMRNISRISQLTRDFEISANNWRRRIPASVREDVKRLTSKSAHPELDFRDKIRDLEESLDLFLEEFNSSGLYNDNLKHEMLTIPKRQEFLEDLIARLEDTRFYLRDFDDFYIWQRHWLSLNELSQKVVSALCRIQPNNWQAAFESWYLHFLLQGNFHPDIVWTEDAVLDLINHTRSLNQLFPDQISSLWQERKKKALKDLKSANSAAYKIWFGKDNRTLSASVRAEDLIHHHFHPLSETLPVILTTPMVALDVMQQSQVVYDLVLVDEGHNIPKQECYHLFNMAKRLVVFGDEKQDMTPFADDDILEFCKGIGANAMHLDYQHQDTPEGWVRFNKIAFKTPFKRIPSGRSALDSTIVMNVEGRYDESSRTNEAEARQVIDWLNLIEQTPAHTYPVVGIACSTVQQRDLIASQLLRIRQRKMAGWEKIQQLILNGLGVYQFAEMQGQHVDILILSLTHGVTDTHGTLTRDLHFWNTNLGINQLHVVLTRATQKFYIAHSIPEGLHAVLAADRNFLGTCILSHLVTFADHLQRGESEAAEEQLTKMKGLLNYTESYFEPTLFSEEVEYALRPYFDTSQMKKSYQAAGVRVPLFIKGTTDEEPSSAIAFDGVLSKTELPSYEWEFKLNNYFRKTGISYIPVLSAHWWRSPKQEARKLTSKLLKGNREEE
jgi:hypothetical protein